MSERNKTIEALNKAIATSGKKPEERQESVQKDLYEGTFWGKLNNVVNTASAAISWTRKTASNSYEVVKGLYQNIAKPVIDRIAPPVVWTYQKWKEKIWDRYAYKTSDDGSKKISWQKATAVSLATVAAISSVPSTVTGTLGFAWDGARMATSMRDEKVVANKPELQKDGSFLARACIDKGQTECSSDEGRIYRLESSAANHLWSIKNNRTIFNPQMVASSITDGAKCDFRVYAVSDTVKIGSLTVEWRKLLSNFDAYPHLLKATCHQMGEPAGKTALLSLN